MFNKVINTFLCHRVKIVRIQSFSGQYFCALRLNAEFFEVNLGIQSECRKLWTRKTPNTDTYVVCFTDLLQCIVNHAIC